MSMIGFQSLEPGLYQVATPAEMQVITAKVTLREDDHFWTESKRKKQGGEWISIPTNCHTSTTGLLVQSAAIGAHVHSKVVELDRNRVRVVARGYWLRQDGLLEVVEKSKEYDLNAELFKAALKEARSKGAPSQEQTTALVKVATEETALALVNTLPVLTKAKVMEARMEVQTHREALCRTKAENMCHRYFIAQAGGVLKQKPGFGSITIELQRPMLAKKLDGAAVQEATESLFGGPAPTTTPVQIPEEPEGEEQQIIDAEVTDKTETEAAAESGEDTDTETVDGEDEGVWGEEPDGAESAEDDPPTTCQADGCQNPLSQKVIDWCQSHAEEFGGLLLCFDCQQKMKKGQKAGAKAGA
ncbi:MAG: hypothetical protein JXC32_17810 [Anaerolineae bacterium]|nr:hypothetical protein [Anaerolineae bacterium]